jgi:hypothetical protein
LLRARPQAAGLADGDLPLIAGVGEQAPRHPAGDEIRLVGRVEHRLPAVHAHFGKAIQFHALQPQGKVIHALSRFGMLFRRDAEKGLLSPLQPANPVLQGDGSFGQFSAVGLGYFGAQAGDLRTLRRRGHLMQVGRLFEL